MNCPTALGQGDPSDLSSRSVRTTDSAKRQCQHLTEFIRAAWLDIFDDPSCFYGLLGKTFTAI